MLRYKAGQNSIITLEIPEEAITNETRSVYDPEYAKYRTNCANVVDIIDPVTNKSLNSDFSIYDKKFQYLKGSKVLTCFDKNLKKICSKGIHYFKTKKAALSWYYKYNNYKAEIPDGPYMQYYSDGRKYSSTKYKNGKKHGKRIVWNLKGEIIETSIYKKGGLITKTLYGQKVC